PYSLLSLHDALPILTSAWIVQEVAVERRAPVLEHPHEPAARYVFGHVLLEQESQSQSVQRSTERERGVAEDEGPRDGHRDGLAPLLELPSIDGPARPGAVGEIGRASCREVVWIGVGIG